MNSKLLLTLCIVGLTQAALTVDLTKHCACTELTTQTDCGYFSYFCGWSGSSCVSVSLTCSDLTASSTLCQANASCTWSNSTCSDAVCGDKTTYSDCVQLEGCTYTSAGKCQAFSQCSDYTATQCPGVANGCSSVTGSCANIAYVTCSAQTSTNCSGYYQTSTLICRLNDSNTCASVSTTPSCSDLTSFQTRCNATMGCTYASSTCRQTTCADLTQPNCYGFYTQGSTTYNLCQWNNSACVDATDVSTYLSSQALCYAYTGQNYKWSDSKCVSCSSLVDNSPSNAYILGATLLVLSLFA